MSFFKAASSIPDETLRAAAGGFAVAAEAGWTASLPAGTAEEELVEGMVAAPNCPERKTWAALANFDLMSCAGAVCWPGVDEVAGDVADEVAAGALAVSELAAADAAGTAAEAIWILTAKLPLQAGAPEMFAPRKRWPGCWAVSCLPLPTRTGAPCASNRAIRAPAE